MKTKKNLWKITFVLKILFGPVVFPLLSGACEKTESTKLVVALNENEKCIENT